MLHRLRKIKNSGEIIEIMTIAIKIILGVFLIINTITDIRNKSIKIPVLAVFSIIGIIMYIMIRPVAVISEIGGIITGTLFIVISYLTKGKIGMGDALLMTVTGIYLGAEQNIILIMEALFITLLYSIVLIIFKKAGRDREIAFAPFMLISFLGMVAI